MSKMDTDRICEMGHREFVGGDGNLWDQIGQLQLNFLRKEGLKPENVLLDIACGSLRAGRLFIDYLNPGNYIGLDKEINLIIHGVGEELGMNKFVEKSPYFVVSGAFEFNKLPARPDYSIAQSLFTHLTAVDIYSCLKSLRDYVNSMSVFYATFFEVPSPVENPLSSDARDCFFYTRDQLLMLAELSGWRMHYIGDWDHPRDQKIVKFEPKI